MYIFYTNILFIYCIINKTVLIAKFPASLIFPRKIKLQYITRFESHSGNPCMIHVPNIT